MTPYEETHFEYFLPTTPSVELPLRADEETRNQAHALWQRIEDVVMDTRERRIAYLLFNCGLSPKEIVQHCTREFTDIQEVYILRCALMKQLIDIV